jgi:hypothetical protein
VRDHFTTNEIHIGGAVAGVFRRQRVGAEVRGRHLDAAPVGQRLGGAQLAQLRLHVESVAGLDLDRRDALGEQRVEARQGLSDE